MVSAYSILTALIVSGGLMWISLSYVPVWISDTVIEKFWTRINLLAGSSSFLLGAVMAVNGAVWLSAGLRMMIACSVSAMTFVLIQTFFTDGFLRFADRRILRCAIAISAVIGSWVLLTEMPSHVHFLVYVFLFLGATIVLFLPNIGASDGRALQLVIAASFPILLLDGLQWAMIAFLLVIFLYGAYFSVKQKSLKGFFTKMSVPMVPLIIFPFLMTEIVFVLLYMNNL